MQSLLTRRIFRQIVYNAVHTESQCILPLATGCLRARSPSKLPTTQKRSIFGFSRNTKRQPKLVHYEPGFEMMLELKNKLRRGERTQSPEQLTQAFVEFFRYKSAQSLSLEDIQAEHALTTFDHLKSTYDVQGFGLTSEELRMALKMLRMPCSDAQYKMHNKLARVLYEELKKRREVAIVNEEPSKPLEKDLVPFIQIMSQCGDALYARDLIQEFWDICLKELRVSPWSMVLRGLIREGRSQELHRTIDMMQSHGCPFDPKVHQIITVYYATIQGDMKLTKEWYKHPAMFSTTAHTDTAVLKLCIKENELEWGDEIFKSLLEKNPEEKSSWNMIFQWAAAKGKSVDEIERMMQVMVRRTQGKGNALHPDMDTINGLVELANSRNDPYTAERYVALGQKLGFEPNTKTYLLQLDYRIKVGDLGGARTAYARLQGEEVPNNEDLPLVNRLIFALCSDKRQDYEAIMALVEDLSERKARFEAGTVAALALIHLQRSETDDLVDLLNTHAFHYGTEQRAKISNVLLRYCLDPATPNVRAWDTYNVLRQVFTEIDVATRTKLMHNFFSRQRSDMATHVFGHMRQQQIRALRPTAFTYAQCLTCIGDAMDEESLATVHNMLNLDSGVEPNTQLYNALMLAYSGCGKGTQALGFWEDIVHSREGPSYASIQIALRSCEKAPFGERVARDIWSKLKRFEIEVTREIYAAYMGAFAGQNMFEECVRLIDEAEREMGYKPDALLYVS